MSITIMELNGKCCTTWTWWLNNEKIQYNVLRLKHQK